MEFSNESQLCVNGTSIVEQFLSVHVRDIFFKMNGFLILPVASAGVLMNIVNMRTFSKMGFQSNTNTAFFLLSVTDFLSECLYLLTAVILLDMSMVKKLPARLPDVLYVIGPVVMSLSAVGSWTTAIINCNRCWCIVRPVKGKKYITRRTIWVLFLGMLVFQVATLIARLSTMNFSLEIKCQPSNRSLQVVLDQFHDENESYISLTFWSSSFVSAISMVVIFASTTFLAITLRRRERWLQSLPGSLNWARRRERNLARTVEIISLIYIWFTSPGVLTVLAFFGVPALNPLDPRNVNLSFVLASYITLFQALSCMLNTFVYFKTMSHYNHCLRKLFCLSTPENRTFLYSYTSVARLHQITHNNTSL